MAVFLLKANEARARACLSVKLFSTDPTVGVAYEDVGLDCEQLVSEDRVSSGGKRTSSMKDKTPLRIVPTDHAGTHLQDVAPRHTRQTNAHSGGRSLFKREVEARSICSTPDASG